MGYGRRIIDDELVKMYMENDKKEIVPSERKDGVGTTPQTAYSVAYFYDENHIGCNKEDACYINIVEYDAKDNRVQETYGINPTNLQKKDKTK